MAKNRSILLVTNARPFEVRKLFYYHNGPMKRLMGRSRRIAIEIPKLFAWKDAPLWTDAGAMLASSQPTADIQRNSTAPEAPAKLASRSAPSVAVSSQRRRVETPEASALDHEIDTELAAALANVDDAIANAPLDEMNKLLAMRNQFREVADRVKADWGE